MIASPGYPGLCSHMIRSLAELLSNTPYIIASLPHSIPCIYLFDITLDIVYAYIYDIPW